MTPPTTVTTIIGLGNPGRRYVHTRHNAGFLVVDALAEHLGATFRSVREAEEARADSITLVKPLTFMNASGKIVQRYATKTKPEHILVIHDDLDLPLGRLRFKFAGSSGGQRGVQDTISRIGKDFYRLKVGIDRPPAGWEVQRWVLSPFQNSEQDLLAEVITAARDAVLLALDKGINHAMGHYNGRDLRVPDKPQQASSTPSSLISSSPTSSSQKSTSSPSGSLTKVMSALTQTAPDAQQSTPVSTQTTPDNNTSDNNT
ncbi:MAG: aminoacyl-tRNA hydrolase, partial [Deinococcota bacterium]